MDCLYGHRDVAITYLQQERAGAGTRTISDLYEIYALPRFFRARSFAPVYATRLSAMLVELFSPILYKLIAYGKSWDKTYHIIE